MSQKVIYVYLNLKLCICKVHCQENYLCTCDILRLKYVSINNYTTISFYDNKHMKGDLKAHMFSLKKNND